MNKKTSFVEGLTKRHLVELDACTRCSECLKWCPVQEVTDNLQISPPEKIKMYKEFIKNTEGLKARLFGPGEVSKKLLEDFTKAVLKMVDMGLGPIGPQANMPGVIERTGNPYDKPADQRYEPWFPEDVKVVEKADIGYYAGCTGVYEAQPMVRGDVLALGAIGEPFTMLPAEEEVCCGFPLFITGQHDMLEDLTKRLVEAYKAKGVKVLISSCPCCVNIMSRDWPLFYGQELPFKIRHITQYVQDAIKRGKISAKKDLRERLIYHDPCYLSRGVGVIEEPRFVLKSIPGIELMEFDRHGVNSQCCGAGGAARKVFHDNAIAMGRTTIDEAVEEKADKLILSCPACYAKVNEAMEEHENKIPIVDIMELFSGVL
jgi:heterodisulfide reductase subunit D